MELVQIYFRTFNAITIITNFLAFFLLFIIVITMSKAQLQLTSTLEKKPQLTVLSSKNLCVPRITAYEGKRQSDADLSANTRPDLGRAHAH